MSYLRKGILLGILICTAASGWAQRAPGVPYLTRNGSDLTGSFQVFVKDTHLDVGYGVAASGTEYVTQHLGVRGEFEYSSMNPYDYKEFGLRGGLAYKIHPREKYQPYIELLAGYGATKANGLVVNTGQQINAFSLLGGGGVDYQLSNRWYARVGADVVSNIASKNGNGNKFARSIVGISYHFGNNR
ncbi:MAG: outer membrane beta-barrel protein [Acidobacteriota bacterium]|nr:outer membrane beta-barrel protein [Acidobacteriota bacterium]